MNEWWLLLCLIVLSLLALPLALYPLRKTKMLMAIFLPLFIMVLTLSYWQWGAWPAWRKNLQRTVTQQKVAAVLQTIKSPAQLIDRLKASLKANPESSRGWYLLGRLYASQGQWSQAHDAFLQAQLSDANDEAIAINYIQSLWQLNKQQFNLKIRTLLKNLLQKNPQQPDALALLAMDAFQSQHYQLAIDYWQQLLQLAPEQSEESQAIRKAIAKAQQRLDA